MSILVVKYNILSFVTTSIEIKLVHIIITLVGVKFSMNFTCAIS